jgi:HEAT repeat protein
MYHVANPKRPPSVNGVSVPYDLTVPELTARLRPPGPQAWAACTALGFSDTEEALSVLLGLLTDPDWRYRRVAVEALGAHRLVRSIATQIVARLSDPSAYVVRTACQVVADLRLTEAHNLLRQLISSPEPRTREAAVAALSPIWLPDDFEPVFQLYQSEDDRAVRRAAAWCLAANASPSNWRRLFDAWLNDPVPRHRVWACELAAHFGDSTVEPDVRQLLSDENGHVRKAANRAHETIR